MIYVNYFLSLHRLWYVGLTCMLRGIRKQISLVDRSMLWLKELYIQLYYENGGCEPLASDALRVSWWKKIMILESCGRFKNLCSFEKF